MPSKYNHDKIAARVRKIHWWYATKHNPGWRYHELLNGICSRLPNHILKTIMQVPDDSWFGELKKYAAYQMFLRLTVGEVCNNENREEIDGYYRETKARCGLCLRPRRGILVVRGVGPVIKWHYKSHKTP